MTLDANALLQTGGVLAFAVVVYRQIEKLVIEARKQTYNSIRMMERQDVIMERQLVLYAQVGGVGVLPAPPPKNGTQTKEAA